jgi:outer membrane protein OmpA-like peptidoglycan-associated protein
VVSFSEDGKEFFGLFWRDGETSGSVWHGSRPTGTIQGCGLNDNSAREQLANELSTSGRTRVYGILFDTNSATIRPESKPALDDIIAVLQSHNDWSMVIEGHTDATGGEAHNRQLSEARAQSVRSYLVNAGIAAERLTTQGFGATKPVAPNETELGRAQNRRVELAKSGS